MRPLLEVIATHPGDAAGAQQGGADRLRVCADPARGGLTPPPTSLRALRAETHLPLHAALRGNDDWSTTGSELSRLQGAAYELAAAGADGFVVGFCGPTLEVDLAAVGAVVEHVQGLPWTFSRAFDMTLDHDRSWRLVRSLPGLLGVHTAGSARGLDDGLDDVCRRAATDSEVARLTVVGGGLAPGHVPWLARAGVRSYSVGRRARPGASWKAYVDAGHVRSWRTLLDDAVQAAG